MARNAVLTFGLLTFPIKLDTATDKAVSLTNLCPGQPGKGAHDLSPVKMPRTCDSCGPITDYTVLKKGLKQGSSYVVLDASDLSTAKESYGSTYKGHLNFVPHPAEQFMKATAPGETLHYITPADAGGANHYQMLVRLVADHPELSFVTLYTPVSATNLYVLSVRDDVLVLEQRVRTQALKPAPSVGGTINEQLFDLLSTQISMFVTEYNPDTYEDGYAAAVQALAEGAETVNVGTPATSAPVAMSDDELMVKLRALAGGKKPAARKRTAKKAIPKKGVA